MIVADARPIKALAISGSLNALLKSKLLTQWGVRDYAELLSMLGDANIPLPSLPKEEIEKQFVFLFKKS